MHHQGPLLSFDGGISLFVVEHDCNYMFVVMCTMRVAVRMDGSGMS